MAHFYRIVFLFFFSVSAHATITPITGAIGYYAPSIGSTDCRETVASFCTGVYTVIKTNGCANSTNTSFFTVASGCTLPSTCPVNSIKSGSLCLCKSGYSDVAGVCVSTANPVCSTLGGQSDLFLTGSMPVVGSSYCPSAGNAIGCSAKVTGGYATVKDGVKTWHVDVDYDAGTCPPTAPVSDAPTDCDGQVGQVNGVDVCIPFSSDNPPAETVSGTKSAGDGVPTVEKSSNTKCTGASCETTTTTTTTPSGGGASVTTTTTESKPKETFCTENPNSPMCKSSAFSSGSCSAAPVCDGDAVQCGIAKLSWQTACALNPTAGAESALYEAAKGLTGSQTAGAAGSPVSLGPSNFSTTDLIGGGSSGLSDLNITVWKTPITLPLSNLNQYLAMFGNLLLAVAFIIAVSIVRGR